MDHEADPLADMGDQRLGLRHRLHHRLLQHDVDAMVGGHPGDRVVGCERGCDVDRLEAAVAKQVGRVVIDAADAEFLRAGFSLAPVGVADGDDLGTGSPPGAQMVEADQSRADQRDAQRRRT